MAGAEDAEGEAIEDVPSPVDFRDRAQAEAWVRKTVERRPWRPAFFEAFADALNAAFVTPFAMAELGSGPGHLARHILRNCDVRSYTVVDFSPAMHDIARRWLGADAARVRFLEQDFRSPDWMRDMGTVDAVITMQAAHEVRHRARLPRLLRQTRGVLERGGLLLYCDHYADGGMSPDLYLRRDEQPEAMVAAGYRAVEQLHDDGGMALYAARA